MKTLARQRDKAEILRRLKDVRPESRRRWGRMSAHQMVCHLSDSFRMVTGEKPVRHASSLLDRTIVKWIALYLPVHWPAGIRTSPEIDQQCGGTSPVEFAGDVAHLEALLELVTAQTRTLDWPSHPIFGRMSDPAWLRWAYVHMDHHLRQFGA
jgi:hypothetical protein